MTFRILSLLRQVEKNWRKKIITYMVKADFFCHWNVIITSGTTKFKNLFPLLLILKNCHFCGKITKNYVFPTIGQKNTQIYANLALFSQVRLYVICNNNVLLKMSNIMTFSNLVYLEKGSVNRVVSPTNIPEGCHKSCPTNIFLPSRQSHKNIQWPEYSDQHLE